MPHHQSNFGSKLRALTGAERRLLDAVLIHVPPRWGKSPSILAPRSLFAQFLRHKMPLDFSNESSWSYVNAHGVHR
jgi:hypothetical protein